MKPLQQHLPGNGSDIDHGGNGGNDDTLTAPNTEEPDVVNNVATIGQ